MVKCFRGCLGTSRGGVLDLLRGGGGEGGMWGQDRRTGRQKVGATRIGGGARRGVARRSTALLGGGDKMERRMGRRLGRRMGRQMGRQMGRRTGIQWGDGETMMRRGDMGRREGGGGRQSRGLRQAVASRSWWGETPANQRPSVSPCPLRRHRTSRRHAAWGSRGHHQAVASRS